MDAKGGENVTGPVAVPGGDGASMASVAPDDAIESRIARDLARRALIVSPLVVIVPGIIWGRDAAFGAAIALALVAVNFLVSAAILSRAARISPELLMGVALGGFILRLAAITLAGWGVKQLGWVDFTVFCVTLVVTHLGLLAWETRSISMSLASPGLRPVKKEVW